MQYALELEPSEQTETKCVETKSSTLVVLSSKIRTTVYTNCIFRQNTYAKHKVESSNSIICITVQNTYLQERVSSLFIKCLTIDAVTRLLSCSNFLASRLRFHCCSCHCICLGVGPDVYCSSTVSIHKSKSRHYQQRSEDRKQCNFMISI